MPIDKVEQRELDEITSKLGSIQLQKAKGGTMASDAGSSLEYKRRGKRPREQEDEESQRVTSGVMHQIHGLAWTLGGKKRDQENTRAGILWEKGGE